jgi:crotonobetaine/carnitine-CoA ligase
MQAWFGINYLGAVFAPVNTAYRGRLLEHVLRNTGAELLIAHASLADRLAGIDTGRLKQVALIGGEAPLPPSLEALRPAALMGDGEAFEDPAPIEPWDVYGVIYTSGTTGPSKGVLQTYMQIWTTGRCTYGYMRDDDRMVINLPLFHVGGTSATFGVLSAGGSFAMFERFDTARFWQELRETQSTVTSGLIGSMAEFLLKAEPRPDDADNPLRMLTMVPINDKTIAFAKRFAFDWLTGFNMTEVSVPLVTPVNSTIPYCCGRPRTGCEARIVDEHDIELPPGAVGELILRTDLPWAITPGYLNMPEATVRAWRNGWFHTGDAFRRDADGNFFFVDRLKDTIRRRGENVSSVEVETELLSYPGVLEAAAVGVPSPHGEEEILACLAPKPGAVIEPAQLILFLRERMAHFMVPRYVRLCEALPKTPTNKVRKADLRAAGVTADTWDREAAGIVVKGQRFNKS